MAIRGRARWAALTLALALLLPAGANAQNAYITNSSDNTVSVINTATNTVVATIPVGQGPYGVAVMPDGAKAYVTHFNDLSNMVSVIDTVSNSVTVTIPVARTPSGVAITPGGTKAYVGNYYSDTVSVIATASNTVVATISLGANAAPLGIAVTPNGAKVYVTNATNPGTVSVIATGSNTVLATISVGHVPIGVAVTPDGAKVYVANSNDNTVSVIDTASDKVVATIPVGRYPFGEAITLDGAKVYVTNSQSYPSTVSVIDTASDKVVATIAVSLGPEGIAITPDGAKAYIANDFNDSSIRGVVSVIDTATNKVVGAPIPVGNSPAAFGKFIASGFLASPLSCGDPACSFPYNKGAYTYGSINSVLDHSLKQNSPGGFWQYGTTASGGGDGVIIAFNGEKANGPPQGSTPSTIVCITGAILLKPTLTSPPGTAMVNKSGCNSTSNAYVYSSYDEHSGYDYRAAMNTPVKAAAGGVVVNNVNDGGTRCVKTNIASCATFNCVGVDHRNGYISRTAI